MAKINQSRGANVVVGLESLGNNLLQRNKTEIKSSNSLENIVGVEGFTDHGHSQSREQQEQNLSGSVKTEFEKQMRSTGVKFEQIGMESLTGAQCDAGAIVLMAAKDPVKYMSVAGLESYAALGEGDTEGNTVSQGSFGTMDAGMQALGMEYFSDVTLDKYMGASFCFNVMASRQDHFAETIMPTIVADPTEAGLMLEVKKLMVHRAVRHALNEKDSVPFNRRNILDAATDASLLEDEATKFVPYRHEDDSNAKYFISKDLYTPRLRQVGDHSVMTAPLAFGHDKHLLQLSAHPGLVRSGVLDESDEISGRIELDNLYFTIGKKNGDPKDIQLLKIKTANLARATFNKSQEGDGMEMELSFRNAAFTLADDSVDASGAEITAIDELVSNKYRLTFTVEVKNTLNIQTGAETSLVSGVKIKGLYDEEDELIDIEDGAGKAIVEKLEILPVGYEYKTTLTNANRRVKGILTDSVTERERYKIQLGSPITSRKPIGRTDNSQAIEDLITVARMRNTNQAVTKILNVTEVLAEVVKSIGGDTEYSVPSIEGIGRHYVRPWYDRVDINVQDLTASLDNVAATKNISATVLNLVREQVVRAIQESRFQPALEMLSGYTMSKPKVIIGTDIYIANWLEVVGDKRTLGDMLEYEIVTTTDSRWHGRLQWFFSVSDGTSGLNPLNWGNHLWIPELITDTNLTRNDGTANEVTVQPRNTHIVNCPITGVINIEGIEELIASRPQLGVASTTPIGGGEDIDGGDLVPPGAGDNG